MTLKVKNISKRMGARSLTEQPQMPGSPSAQDLVPAVVNTVVRRLGVVALAAFNQMMSNCLSRGSEELAEALNDSLKPLVDALLHFDVMEERELEQDTEVDHEVP